jgi:TPR repeat protein
MLPTNTARYKYTPDEMSETEFLERFVVRQEVFDEIFEELKEADYSVPNQHYIIVGQRGQGKTTLLRKLKLEIERDKKLSKFLLPVKFSEEQYRVRQLCRFWEEVADYLQTFYEDMFDGLLSEIEEHIDDENYPEKCFSYLEKKLKKHKKKLLLLVDNIDEFLTKLKPKEQHQLREILLTSSSFVIVGGSTKMFEQQYDYSKPFYEFFKIIRLEALSFDESVALLKVLGDEKQSKKIDEIIAQTPQRIETLRRVTGGVPRTMVMLFDIFVEDNGNAFDDLMKILDEVTPLYKDRMDDLPPVLQEIVDTIALNWDGMSTKEIAKKTRIESKVVSAQMKQLEKYQIVDSDAVGKNKIYIIKERFFNIWYLMRYGRKKDRTKVEWLVKFLLAWYSPKELEEKANSFRDKLSQGERLNDNYVLVMGEALAYTGRLNVETEYRLKESMRTFLKSKNSTYASSVSDSDKELLSKAFEYYNKKEYDKALELLVNSKRESGIVLNVIAMIYTLQKKYGKAEEYYLEAIKNGDTDALNNLGVLYKEQKEYDKAEEYYLKAIKSGNTNALNNLGYLYYEQKEYDKVEEYYLKAIESGNTGAQNSLTWFYFERAKKGEEALKLIQRSYESKQYYHNTHTYAVILLWQEAFELSYEKFLEWLAYEDAIEAEEDMIIYLTLLMAKGQYYKAKAFFELPQYELKDRYKPLWYALMMLMKEEFPVEIKKMGSELKETVDEILTEVENMREKYGNS